MLTLNSDFSDELWQPPEAKFKLLLDFENEVLSEVPHNDISLLTQRNKRSFLNCVRQGIMLDAVRRYRLYKRHFRDFAEYCKLGLGRSPFYCKRIIQAAQICLRLIKSNKFKILPTSVAQALPLLKFAKVDEYGDSQLQDKWQAVLENFPPQNITAAKIAECLDENPEDRPKQIRIGDKVYQSLQKKAAAAGMAISKYLEMLIIGEPPDDEPPPDDEERTELTAQKEAICDRAEAFAKAKPARQGFAIKKLSRCHHHQNAVRHPNVRSDYESDSS